MLSEVTLPFAFFLSSPGRMPMQVDFKAIAHLVPQVVYDVHARTRTVAEIDRLFGEPSFTCSAFLPLAGLADTLSKIMSTTDHVYRTAPLAAVDLRTIIGGSRPTSLEKIWRCHDILADLSSRSPILQGNPGALFRTIGPTVRLCLQRYHQQSVRVI